LKTYAIYDAEDFPVVVGDIVHCTTKTGLNRTDIYNMVARTKKDIKKKKTSPGKYHAYVIAANDELFDRSPSGRKNARRENTQAV